MTSDANAEIAARFVAARRGATALDSYPGAVPTTLDDAYAIQEHAIAAWGIPVLGWKIGRVLPPYSEAFGTDRFAGPIFATREAGGDITDMPVFDGGYAAAEAEFLMRIGTAPPPGQTRFTLEEAADLIDAVHIGFEIASSPLASLNALGPAAVTSDFGNNAGLLIGDQVDDWRESGLENWPVTILIDGSEVGSGPASALPDGPLGGARFLFELMAERGVALEPGQWISTGAAGGVHRAHPGQTVEARFGEFGSVRCRLIPARPEQLGR
jgi:2-keto-4-pentenoate hydratase